MKVNAAQLAKIFDRTDRHVQLLVKDGMPKIKHGEYDLEECAAWYIRYLQRKISQRSGSDEDEGKEGAYNVERERARLVKAQADGAELELAKKRRQLVPVSAFTDAMSKMISAARQQILQLPGRLAPQLEGEPRAVIKVKLQDSFAKTLTGLSVQAPPALEDNGDDPETDA